MTRQEAATAPEVITGKLYLHDLKIYAFIDPGSTHSFISSFIVAHLRREPELLVNKLGVHTPLGDVIMVHKIYRDCVIQIGTAGLLQT